MGGRPGLAGAGATMYGCDLSAGIPQFDPLLAQLAAEGPSPVETALFHLAGEDPELGRRAETAAAHANYRDLLLRLCLMGEQGALARELTVALRELFVRPGALAATLDDAKLRKDTARQLLDLPAKTADAGALLTRLADALKRHSPKEPAAALGLSRPKAHGEYARAATACLCDFWIEKSLQPARRALARPHRRRDRGRPRGAVRGRPALPRLARRAPRPQEHHRGAARAPVRRPQGLHPPHHPARPGGDGGLPPARVLRADPARREEALRRRPPPRRPRGDEPEQPARRRRLAERLGRGRGHARLGHPPPPRRVRAAAAEPALHRRGRAGGPADRGGLRPKSARPAGRPGEARGREGRGDRARPRRGARGRGVRLVRLGAAGDHDRRRRVRPVEGRDRRQDQRERRAAPPGRRGRGPGSTRSSPTSGCGGRTRSCPTPGGCSSARRSPFGLPPELEEPIRGAVRSGNTETALNLLHAQVRAWLEAAAAAPGAGAGDIYNAGAALSDETLAAYQESMAGAEAVPEARAAPRVARAGDPRAVLLPARADPARGRVQPAGADLRGLPLRRQGDVQGPREVRRHRRLGAALGGAAVRALPRTTTRRRGSAGRGSSRAPLRTRTRRRARAPRRGGSSPLF